MWLLTAVGPVQGQRQFTFALEKNRTYTIGRSGQDINCSVKTVRPLEGTLQVGDWNPDDPSTPPTLVWSTEPKKNGSYPVLKVLSQQSGEPGSTLREDYSVEEKKDEYQVSLGEPGKGVELSADLWFLPRWEAFAFCYDEMKNETKFKELFTSYCVSWISAMGPDQPVPDVLIAPLRTAKSNDCSYAVCYGVPIVKPEWLEELAVRLRVCWKQNADSEDSFTLPDNSRYTPPLDNANPQPRKAPGTWRTSKDNRELFSSYRVVGLAARPMPERRWFTAMGAEWDDLDVVSRPLLSSNDFMSRIAPSVESAAVSGRQVLVAYYPSVSKELEKRNVNFDSVVLGACRENGIPAVGAAPVLWGAVNCGSVETRLAELGDLAKRIAEQDGTKRRAAQDNDTTTPAVSKTPEPAAAAAAPPAAPPAPEPTTRLPRRAGTGSRSASRAPSAPPAAPEEAIVEPLPPVVPETESSASTTSAPRPLVRRAGRQAKTKSESVGYDLPPVAAADSLSSRALETQLSSDSQSQGGRNTFVPDSMDVDTHTDAFPAATRSSGTGGLRRRAGERSAANMQSSKELMTDKRLAMEEEILRKEQTQTGYAQLYASSKREPESINQGPSKRPRTRRNDEESVAQSMDIDEDDFIAKALKGSRKREPSPAKLGRAASIAPVQEVSEPEEVEQVVEQIKRPKTEPGKEMESSTLKPASSAVTKDDAFLQAIKVAKGKKAIDELDEEFNQMRIPKPNGKLAQDLWRPDYTMVNDFDSDMHGNFIQVVQTDLFRKDKPRTSAPITDDGRPNFKKFKKKNIVRRQPVTLVLAAQTELAEEMGEPYWAAEEGNPKRTQTTLAVASRNAATPSLDDDDDDAPLLPRARTQRRLLTQVAEDDDDEEVQSLSLANRRRGPTPLTQSAGVSRARGRSTRASSAVSDVSSASVAPPPKRVRQTPAQRIIQVPDDSDPESVPFATARSSRSRRVPGTAGQYSTTLDFEDEPLRSTRATAASGSTRTGTRRKMLVEDDNDDDLTFKAMQKKRRIG